MSEQRRRIEAARAYAEISSQAELAERIEMTEATFKRRLAGTYPFRRADLLAIAEVCQVPLWFLLHGWEAPEEGRLVEELEKDLEDAIQQADSSGPRTAKPGRASENG